MKAVVDDKIPFIRGVLEPWFEVEYLPGQAITRAHLMDADVLIIRTRTTCNEALLKGTRVKFIGSATIGFDHIDTAWCEANGITWTNAPGCNAGSVAQYVTAALFEMAERQQFNLKDKTLGIIGVGHVGSKVEHIARSIGMRVLLNDPPRARVEGEDLFSGLWDVLAESDIVTIHVPLNREGPDRTLNLVNRDFIRALKPGAILINTSRGEVMEEDAMIEELRMMNEEWGEGSVSLVLDVWRNEPHINLELMHLAAIATPHIAGYSLDGKRNATRKVIEGMKDYGGLRGVTEGDGGLRWVTEGDGGSRELTAGYESLLNGDITENFSIPGMQSPVSKIIAKIYSISSDDLRLRQSPETFEEQRGNYPVRRDFDHWILDPWPGGEVGEVLRGMGFRGGV